MEVAAEKIMLRIAGRSVEAEVVGLERNAIDTVAKPLAVPEFAIVERPAGQCKATDGYLTCECGQLFAGVSFGFWCRAVLVRTPVIGVAHQTYDGGLQGQFAE